MGSQPSVHVDDTWQDATGPSAEVLAHRGLINKTGSNVCFLNVCLQALWHLAPFRAALLSQAPHHHSGPEASKCMTCALISVYTFYTFTEEEAVPPDEARQALALLDSALFPLGEMADASETLEKILACLHGEAVEQQRLPSQASATAPADPERLSCQPPCAAHAGFSMEFFTWLRCKRCGASTEPSPQTSFVYPVYVADVHAAIARLSESHHQPYGLGGVPHAPSAPPDLSTVLSMIAYDELSSQRDVLGRSGGLSAASVNPHVPGDTLCTSLRYVFPERFCIRPPPVFCMSLRWPAADATRDAVSHALHLVSQLLDFRALFKLELLDSLESEAAGGGEASAGGPAAAAALGRERGSNIFRLRGFVAYYGKHYTAFVASEARREWLLLDDQRVIAVGSWAAVVARCISSRYQPTMLFYEQMSHSPLAGAPAQAGGVPTPERPTSAVPPVATSTTDWSSASLLLP